MTRRLVIGETTIGGQRKPGKPPRLRAYVVFEAFRLQLLDGRVSAQMYPEDAARSVALQLGMECVPAYEETIFPEYKDDDTAHTVVYLGKTHVLIFGRPR